MCHSVRKGCLWLCCACISTRVTACRCQQMWMSYSCCSEYPTTAQPVARQRVFCDCLSFLCIPWGFLREVTSARHLGVSLVITVFTHLHSEDSRAGTSLAQPCAEQVSVFPFRGLCVDALIELSDENADWKLSFNEFLKCLSPSFNPPEKSRNSSLILGNKRGPGKGGKKRHQLQARHRML